MRTDHTLRMPTTRPTLRLAVVCKSYSRCDSETRLGRVLWQSACQKGILFCGSMSESENTGSLLSKNGRSAAPCHTGRDDRKQTEMDFEHGEALYMAS